MPYILLCIYAMDYTHYTYTTYIACILCIIYNTFTNMYVIVFDTTKCIVNMTFMIAIIVLECLSLEDSKLIKAQIKIQTCIFLVFTYFSLYSIISSPGFSQLS